MSIDRRVGARLDFVLDDDEEGEPGASPGLEVAAQDAAFCEAMRQAMQRGKEKPPAEGVQTTPPHENRYVRRVHVPTFVRSASTSYYE